MTTLPPERINDLIEQRETLTNRRDEHIDFDAVDAIDAQLATVPAGVNNTLDLRLGRPSAVLPERVEYQRRSTDEQAAQAKQDAFIACLINVYDEWLDYERIKGDLAI